jgi:large subunit ribosomal protein L4e
MRTYTAAQIMEALGASADCDKAKDSKKIRAGKGKMRNRRYVLRRGPLVIYDTKESIDKAFRNLPGVETTSVDRLNLLQLAPGGHMGRFCVWTQVCVTRLLLCGDAPYSFEVHTVSTALHSCEADCKLRLRVK